MPTSRWAWAPTRPNARSSATSAPGLGKLYKLSRFGDVREVADIAGFEAAENPDGFVPDSNPNSVFLRHGRRIVVVDAGRNDVLRVRRNGAISTLAVFPVEENVPQPVPTAVVAGPDGALYVSQLVGFPFPVGAARIFRVVPGSEPEVFADGLTNVTDLAFGPDGSPTSWRSRPTACSLATRRAP